MNLLTSDYDYQLPAELIAQEPASRRDQSRLLVFDRETGNIRHSSFDNLPTFLKAGDIVVANRSRVIPARLAARKPTGGRVEILLLRALSESRWTALARPSRKLQAGMCLIVEKSELTATLESRDGKGEWSVRFDGDDDVPHRLREAGSLPLPPYIHNDRAPSERYQTVFADRDGSVAAPTAGLHFTPKLLQRLGASGIHTLFVTLHVGVGTFRPVHVEHLSDHRMLPEWGEVPRDVADVLCTAKTAGRRIVAIGTTTTRLLESAADEHGLVRPFRGETDRFIYPGYQFRAIDGLVTNFHLPRSTLLMLVSALAGRERMLEAYAEAIRRRYRFYSFGDAMLII